MLGSTEDTQAALQLFGALLDSGDATRERLLASAPESVRLAVLEMLAIDAGPTSLHHDEVIEALTSACDDLGPVEPDPAPPTPPGFVVHECVGKGAMGAVHRATQLVPRREVALKFVVGDGVEEAQALADCSHPAVPAVYSAGRIGEFTYVAMELIDGVPLHVWSRTAVLEEKLRVFQALAEGCHAIHELGIVHRDLKPANVLVTDQGPVLVDFGLASSVDRVRMAGTLTYMADEVFSSGCATPRSDVFSLTCILVALVTGERAMPSANTVSGHRARRAAWQRPALPPALDSIATRGLAPEEQRYRSAAELAEDVSRVRKGLFPTAYRPSLSERVHRLWRTRPTVVVASALLTGGLVVALGWSLWSARALEREQQERYALLQDQIAARPSATMSLLDGYIKSLERSDDPGRQQARLWRAAELRLADRELEARSDLAEVFSVGTGAQRVLAATALAEGFLAEGEWAPLKAVATEVVDPERRVEFERAAAVGIRDWNHPSVDAIPMFGALHQAQEFEPVAQAWVVADRLLTLNQATGRFTEGPARQGLAAQEVYEWPQAWSVEPPEIVDLGGPVVVTAGKSRVQLVVARPNEGEWEPVVDTVLEGQPWSAAAHNSTLYVGTAPISRGLRVLQPPEWKPRIADPDIEAVRSDVVQMESADLDGDGVPELVVHLGPWRAFDLRVYRMLPDGTLKLLDRVQQGGGSTMKVVTQPDGQRKLLVLNAHAYPNPEIFGSAHPTGVSKGLYVFRFDEQGLVQEHFLELEGVKVDWLALVAGDFDGDGDPDVVAPTDDGAVFVELGPDSEPLSFHRVAGLSPLVAGNFDDDASDELLVNFRDQPGSWLLGTGDGEVPLLPEVDGVGSGPLGRLGLVREEAERLGTRALFEVGDEAAAEMFFQASLLYYQADEPKLALEMVDEALARSDSTQAQAHRMALLHELGLFDRIDASNPETQDPVSVYTLNELASSLPSLRSAEDGLTLRSVGAEGVLLSVPMRRTGPRVSLDAAFDVLSAEAGAQLSIGLHSEETTLLGAFLEPWGGARQTKRQSSCRTATSRRAPALAPESSGLLDVESHHSIRVAYDGRVMVCDIHSNEEDILYRLAAAIQLPERLTLEIRMHAAGEGERGAMLNAVLREIRVLGVEPTGPPEFAESDETALERLVAERRFEEADRLWMQRAVNTTLLGPIRRNPKPWLDWLASRYPAELPELLAAAFAPAYSSGTGRTTDQAVEEARLDSLPVVSERVADFLVLHARHLRLEGELSRSRSVLERVLASGDSIGRFEHLLELTLVHAEGGDAERAARTCREALEMQSYRFQLADRLAFSEVLRSVCPSE